MINVSDKFRKNPLSLVPGGSKVTVEKSNGVKLVYDKIKDPIAYIARLKFVKDIVNVWVNDIENPDWRIELEKKLKR